jgi:hypothetical protein
MTFRVQEGAQDLSICRNGTRYLVQELVLDSKPCVNLFRTLLGYWGGETVVDQWRHGTSKETIQVRDHVYKGSFATGNAFFSKPTSWMKFGARPGFD